MSNGLIQVVAGAYVRYINDTPYILLGLKPSGIWEFPGGKVEGTEVHKITLQREWMEELGVNIKVEDKHFGHAQDGAFEIWFYEVEITDDTRDEPIAKEHVEVQYFNLLNEAHQAEMNTINKIMLKKLSSKYSEIYDIVWGGE